MILCWMFESMSWTVLSRKVAQHWRMHSCNEWTGPLIQGFQRRAPSKFEPQSKCHQTAAHKGGSGKFEVGKVNEVKGTKFQNLLFGWLSRWGSLLSVLFHGIRLLAFCHGVIHSVLCQVLSVPMSEIFCTCLVRGLSEAKKTILSRGRSTASRGKVVAKRLRQLLTELWETEGRRKLKVFLCCC